MRRAAVVLAVAACGTPSVAPGPRDSDVPAPTDTEPVPVDTEVAPPDSPVDTEPPGPELPPLEGRFVDLTATTWSDGAWTGLYGTEPLDSALFPLDLDGDGRAELIAESIDPVDPTSGLRRGPVLRWDDDTGGYVVDVALTRVLQERTILALAGVADLDGDDRPDLLTLGVDADDPLVRLGDGPGRFVDGDVTLAVDRKFALSTAYLVDLDRDGWLDVLLGQSCRRDLPPFTLLHRVGPRAWRERADLAVPDAQVGVRQLGVVPLGGDLLVAAMGYVCEGMLSYAPGVWKETGETADGLPTYTAFDPLPHDVWFRAIPDVAGGVLNDVAPMGALVVDPDADGRLDFVVAAALDDIVFLGDHGGPAFFDRTLDVGLLFPNLRATNQRQPWSLAALDVDRDARPDLAIAQGSDHEFVSMPADAHVSFTRIYRNDGARFLEAPDGLGLADAPGDWHTLLLADLDADLDADLLVGGWGRPPRVWRNDLVAPGHLLVLRLRGTTSNHLGVGAVVRVEAPGLPPQTRLVGEAHPTNRMADPTLFLGVGDAPTVDVTVTWPSGLVQRFDDVPTDAAPTLVEASTLRVLDDDRAAPADGVARVEVEVTPRAADGASDPSASVAIEQIGAATWDGPATWDGAAWRRVLVAPTTAGESRITATIDGAPVKVRPRVRWTSAAR